MADASDPVSSALLQAATVEFLSTLQLLAERARFLTDADGVGIALKEGPDFVYRAGAGISLETGTPADKVKAPIARCIATAAASAVSSHTAHGQTAKAAVPILQRGDVIGFFELYASRPKFPDGDLVTVDGLAEMVVTALDLMRAAKDVHEQIVENAGTNVPEQDAPLAWHAEAVNEPTSTPLPPAASNSVAPLTVHACQSCGFPISETRQLCVECEQKPDAPRPARPQLIANEGHQSWVETHGYTLASLLVTALVIAIIYWLR